MMISDDKTNKVYFSELLKVKYTSFSTKLEAALKSANISFDYLKYTNDVWCRDFMPLQIDTDCFCSYRYNPDYLQNPRYCRLKTNTILTLQSVGIHDKTKFSEIVLDGGNLVRHVDKLILTNKIFNENSNYSESTLIRAIADSCEIEADNLIVIPQAKDDMFGHSDGMVKFIDANTVLINDYSKEPAFQEPFEEALTKRGLNFICLPYNPYSNTTILSAKGIYTNYLETESAILFPIFDVKEDEAAIKLVETIFNKNIIALNCNDIAKDGGLLNCISWNFLN